jgi:hypothetical protein
LELGKNAALRTMRDSVTTRMFIDEKAVLSTQYLANLALQNLKTTLSFVGGEQCL